MRAGPLDMGSRLTGEGLATGATVPTVVEFEPFTGVDGNQLIADVSGFITRAVDVLVTPAIDHFPDLLPVVGPVPEVVVKLVIVHDHDADELRLSKIAHWWETSVRPVVRLHLTAAYLPLSLSLSFCLRSYYLAI